MQIRCHSSEKEVPVQLQVALARFCFSAQKQNPVTFQQRKAKSGHFPATMVPGREPGNFPASNKLPVTFPILLNLQLEKAKTGNYPASQYCRIFTSNQLSLKGKFWEELLLNKRTSSIWTDSLVWTRKRYAPCESL